MSNHAIRTLLAATALAAVAATPGHAAKAVDPQPVFLTPPPGEQRVQVTKDVTVPPDVVGHVATLVSVPAGKALILDRLNGQLVTLDDGSIRAQLAGGSLVLTMPATPELGGPTGGLRRGSFNEEIGAEFRGPVDVRIGVSRFGSRPSSSTTQNFTVLGRLVDCESCQSAAG